MTDWKPLRDLLVQQQAALAFATNPEKVQYVATMNEAIDKAELRENDNGRAATLIAVDASKPFVQIAIALVAAIAGFLQFSNRSLPPPMLVALGIAGLLAFISMGAGFIVISRAYKRADGRLKQSNPPWSTSALKTPIDWQALSGVLALVIFAVTLALFNIGTADPTRLVVTLPDGKTTTTTRVEPLTITGRWSALTVEQKGRFVIVVPPTQSSASQSLRIETR